MFKRVFLICLALMLALGALPTAFAAVPDSLTVALVAKSELGIHPLTTKQRDPLNLLSLVYEGLVSLDDDRRPVPQLAESWEQSRDGGRWTFRIRDDATFHDGSPVTAADVCATLDQIWLIAGYDEEKKTEVPLEDRGVHCNLYAYINGWSEVDEKTVQINASRSYYGLLYAMTFPVFPAAYLGEAFNEGELPPGTGPYQVEEYTPEERIWITANTSWYEEMPAVQNILGYFYPTTEDALNAYEYQETDIAMTRNLSATRYSGSLSSFFLPYRTPQLEVLLMHHNTSPLGTLAVRQAVSLAIDVQEIIRNAYQNLLATVTYTTVMPGTWLSDATLVREDPNPARAAELLEQEGWILTDDGFRYKTIEGEPTRLSMSILTYDEPGSSVRQNAANMIADRLVAIGINATVNTVTQETASARIKAGNFALALGAYQMDVVPDPGFMIYGSISSNYCRYRSEEMTELIRKLRSAYDEGDFYTAMHEIQTLFLQDVPFLCLYYRNGALLTRYSFTSARDVREQELLRGVEEWQ